MYKPPFTITNQMLNDAIVIASKVERLSSFASLQRLPILRHNNSIASISSSLAIEANSLSLDQVRDVIDGKSVIGNELEINEVKDAYEAYLLMSDYDPYSEASLLRAHGIIASSIDKEAGQYRSHDEGVIDAQGRVIHVAPPAHMVPSLMKDLFVWLNQDKETPLLIKSCIFHYEFVFIHPFGDGNGRTSRLWQNVLLMHWKPAFAFLPIESHIYKYQKDYYDVIDHCNKTGDSTSFIEFMLHVIDESLEDVLLSLSKESKNISEQVSRLLDVMEHDIPLSANEIMRRLGIKSKETLRGSYLNPALQNGLVKMTLPDKPKSKNQKYYK